MCISLESQLAIQDYLRSIQIIPMRKFIRYLFYFVFCDNIIENKFMKDILNNSKLDIIERSWTAVNPNKQYTLSIPKVTQFLRLLTQQHERLQNTQIINTLQRKNKLNDKIHNFILKYILQRQLNSPSKRQATTFKQDNYKLDMKDCLQIWRWLREDQNSNQTINTLNYDELILNQFDISQSSQPFEIKQSVNQSNKSKKIFSQLLLEERQTVIKKSLQMVNMYYHQFKIIFNHYCKSKRQNQYQKPIIFDQATVSLQKLNINRFMLFCRDFDILKTIQFKRKNQHNAQMNKQLLLQIFKKGSYLQKYLNLDGFLLSLVNIALKIHQNFDPRSYMHIELFLNSLKVKYHEQFVKKLDQIGIKYSPTQFLNCYKNIYKKVPYKNRHATKSSIFNNPHFEQPKKQTQINKRQHNQINLKQSQGLAATKKTESLPNIHSKITQRQITQIKKPVKQLHQRKVSLPLLPSPSQNRFFTPLQHNNHLNGFSKYLENKIGNSSSVFKNRITGYSNISKIKSSPFHQLQNPEGVTKQSFKQFINDAKNKINNTNSQQNTRTDHKTTPVTQKPPQMQIKLPIKGQRQTSINMKADQNIVQILRAKMDLRDDDELLNNHLLNEHAKQRSVNDKIIQALKRYSE